MRAQNICALFEVAMTAFNLVCGGILFSIYLITVQCHTLNALGAKVAK